MGFQKEKVICSQRFFWHGLNIELGDIELIDEQEYTDEDGHTETSRISQFKGQWLTCDFGKELAGEV